MYKYACIYVCMYMCVYITCVYIIYLYKYCFLCHKCLFMCRVELGKRQAMKLHGLPMEFLETQRGLVNIYFCVLCTI
jgi:hypothetical protein